MLSLLGGCAASGTGDKMALNDSDRSAQPATKDDTIVFEFGVGLSGPTKRLSTTSSTTTLPSPENADYMRHLARQKLAETKRKSDGPIALQSITMPGWQPLPTPPHICGSCRWKRCHARN